MNSKYDLSEKYVFAIQDTKVIMDNLYFTFLIYVSSLFQVNFKMFLLHSKGQTDPI